MDSLPNGLIHWVLDIIFIKIPAEAIAKNDRLDLDLLGLFGDIHD